jgi:hypothetical protein
LSSTNNKTQAKAYGPVLAGKRWKLEAVFWAGMSSIFSGRKRLEVAGYIDFPYRFNLEMIYKKKTNS